MRLPRPAGVELGGVDFRPALFTGRSLGVAVAARRGSSHVLAAALRRGSLRTPRLCGRVSSTWALKFVFLFLFSNRSI